MLTFNILSVNVGRPTPISLADRQIQTGIFKLPLQNGSVSVLRSGIRHDSICDTSRHGGPDQAVYLFSAEDAAWWSSQLQCEVPAGFFGENITLDRWWPTPRVGDRLVIEQVELELSFPRIPCATLAARVGNPSFLKDFVAANHPGLYARVIRPGEIRAGMQGSVQRASSENPSMHALFACWHETPRDQDLLRNALKAPIVVYYDGSTYWLADGFHRVAAYTQFVNGREASASPRAMCAEIRQGTRRDAVPHACGANGKHGLKRTNADKRRAVEMLLRDEEWRQWSDRKIAAVCAVDHKTVASLRNELTVSGEIPQMTDRIVERNGATYQMTPAARPVKAERPSDPAPDWEGQARQALEAARATADVDEQLRLATSGFRPCAFIPDRATKERLHADLVAVLEAARREAEVRADMATLIPLAAMHGFALRRVVEGFELLRDGERYSLAIDRASVVSTLMAFDRAAQAPPSAEPQPTDDTIVAMRARFIAHGYAQFYRCDTGFTLSHAQHGIKHLVGWADVLRAIENLDNARFSPWREDAPGVVPLIAEARDADGPWFVAVKSAAHPTVHHWNVRPTAQGRYVSACGLEMPMLPMVAHTGGLCSVCAKHADRREIVTHPAHTSPVCEQCGQTATDKRTIGGLLAWRCDACAALATACERAEHLGATIDYMAKRADGRLKVLPPAGHQQQWLWCDAGKLTQLCDAWERQEPTAEIDCDPSEEDRKAQARATFEPLLRTAFGILRHEPIILRLIALSICDRDQRDQVALLPLHQLHDLLIGRLFASCWSSDPAPLLALLTLEAPVLECEVAS